MQPQGRYCRYDEGLGYSSQMQSKLNRRKKALAASRELDWSEPQRYYTDVGKEYVSFQRTQRERQKERCWYVNVSEEIEGLLC